MVLQDSQAKRISESFDPYHEDEDDELEQCSV